jgi:hypothetical protein
MRCSHAERPDSSTCRQLQPSSGPLIWFFYTCPELRNRRDSAVTATTIQFSFTEVDSPLYNMVNAFWYSSLVFSIASAVNSLVGLTWRQAMYRSPGHRVPWWITMWIKRSPLIFLVISVAAFSVGLCLFTYASGQASCLLTISDCDRLPLH